MRIRYSTAARQDLNGIGDHIGCDNPRRAESFVAELMSACEALGTLPLGSPLLERHARAGIRRSVHGRYLIFYRVTETAVEIVRIIHGARDYDALLRRHISL